jgi:PadR family transcriptional regulator AphA
METILRETPAGRYVECDPQGGLIQSENDALDLVAVCGESETQNLLIHAANLPEAFYELRTGLAGVILLKFTNYRIRAAAVLDPAKSGQGRFGEFAMETNRRNDFRIYPDAESAVSWLLR